MSNSKNEDSPVFSSRSPPPASSLLMRKSESSDCDSLCDFIDEVEPREALLRDSAPELADVKYPVASLLNQIDGKTVSAASIERATKTFKLSGNDVLLVGAGIVGEPIVTRMIRLLSARDERDVAKWLEPSVGLSNAPVIESSVYDGEQGSVLLNAKQNPFNRRVFRTSMTYKALQSRLGQSSKGVKTVVVLRHPKDARLAWYSKCRRAFTTLAASKQDEEVKSQILAKFDAKFSPDDFLHSPGAHLVPTPDIDSYEANLADWISHPKSSDVLIILLEEVLAYPERVLDRLALHLGYFSDVCTESILDAVSGPGLFKSPRCGEQLTSEQREFLHARAGRGSSLGELRLKSAMNSAVNISPRGIFVAHRPAPLTARRPASLSITSTGSNRVLLTDVSENLVDDIPLILSHVSLLELKDKWAKLVSQKGGGSSSYEGLYSRLTGDEYPYADAMAEPDSPGDRRTSFLSPLTSSLKKMVSRPRLIMTRGSSTDLMGKEQHSDLSPGSGKSPLARKTFVVVGAPKE